MKKRSLISILLMLSVGFISVNAEAAFTVATFADPAIDGATPRLTISFESGYVDYHNFAADEFFGENVTISGIGITTGSLKEEFFSFAFANQTVLPGSDDGFTATTAFTSSAVPEPATVCLLGLGHWVCQEDEKLDL